jgi:hypothetical protein
MLLERQSRHHCFWLALHVAQQMKSRTYIAVSTPSTSALVVVLISFDQLVRTCTMRRPHLHLRTAKSAAACLLLHGLSVVKALAVDQ